MALTKSQVGRLGALARMSKYGNPGTLEGRRKGGINSILRNNRLPGKFKLAKKHKSPQDCPLLAEFLGILFGDGHLSDYQVLVTTNSETDIKHALYIKRIIKKLFNLNAALTFKKKQKAVNVVVSSVNLVNWLSLKGMPKGNKLKIGFSVPNWITDNDEYCKKFIRGLFDTDGSVYVDKHLIKGKIYQNQGWAFTSYSVKLRNDILNLLRSFGYSPTLRESQRSVYMRRREDIEKYFKEIGSSNPKHLERYLNGRVPKRL